VGECVGAVVDVEQDRVVHRSPRDHAHDIIDDELHARIAEWMSREGAVLAAIPAHHRGHELRDHDTRLARQRIERGAQRVAEAEAADQDAWRPQALEARGDDPAELVLRAVLVGRHQRSPADGDRDVIIPPREHHLLTVGERHALQHYVTAHSASIPRAILAAE
jgi:hypothetical protein